MNPMFEAQSSFNSYDGTAMFYRYWLTADKDTVLKDASSLKVAVLLHRGHEHSGRLTDLAHAFVAQGYQVVAWDARGNGRSGGERDHADSFAQLVRDLDTFITLIKTEFHISSQQIVLIASSLGAVIASAWVHDYAPNIRGLILGTPAFAIRLYVPFANPALKVAKKLGLVNRVSSYVKAQVLTHDKQAQDLYNTDPLISSGISRDLLIDSLATGERLLDDAGAITVPTLVLCAGKDYVVNTQKIREFYQNIRSPIKRWHYYPDSYHAVFHEINKQVVFNDCIAFADEVFAKPVQIVDLSCADKPETHAQSYSKERMDNLTAKGGNLQFMLTRMAIYKLGNISDGVKTGVMHGFDSGASLDKVYENNPKGSNILGKWIDNFYLNNIGWRGIRIRKEHLLELANIAIHNLNKTDKQNIRALDIASGNGYYMFELCQAHKNLSVELRDYDTHNIEVLTQKAQTLSLDNRISVKQADAFNTDSYHDKTAYDLAVASGVFELFGDNGAVMTAINGIYDSLTDEGYFIYTNQPWHPEQEFIGKTLNNHKGKNWVMRCRTQAEMDQLVAKAGFKKVAMRIDDFGIFSVSLAIKDSQKAE